MSEAMKKCVQVLSDALRICQRGGSHVSVVTNATNKRQKIC